MKYPNSPGLSSFSNFSSAFLAALHDRVIVPSFFCIDRFVTLSSGTYFCDTSVGSVPLLNNSVTFSFAGVYSLGSISVPFSNVTDTTLDGFLKFAEPEPL